VTHGVRVFVRLRRSRFPGQRDRCRDGDDVGQTKKRVIAGFVALGAAGFLYCASTGRLGTQKMGVPFESGPLPPR